MIAILRIVGMILFVTVFSLCLSLCTFPPAVDKTAEGSCHEQKDDGRANDLKSCCDNKAILAASETIHLHADQEPVSFDRTLFAQRFTPDSIFYDSEVLQSSVSPPITVLRI